MALGFAGFATGVALLGLAYDLDVRSSLPRIQAPTLVLHRSGDRAAPVDEGRALAEAIPGAELLVIDGMGHDMPADLFGTLTDVIRRTADRAGRDATSHTSA